jgi:hypothetical protein
MLKPLKSYFENESFEFAKKALRQWIVTGIVAARCE